MQRLIIPLIALYAILLIPLCAVTPLSVMAFDAPGSESSILVWILVLTFFSIPLFMLISMVLQGVFFWKKKYKKALYTALLPWIPVGVLVLLFMFAK